MSDEQADDLDAEREVDLRSAWSRIQARWWLPAAGVVAGLALGVVLALGGGQVYKAKTIVFLGQPFAPSGGGQIQSLSTNPRTGSEIVRSETALKAAAAASGLRVGQLRGAISTQAVTTVGQAKATNPLVEISVQGPAPRKVERAADALARRVVGTVAIYVDNKIGLLKQQIAADTLELDQINARVDGAQRQQEEILSNRTLPLAERLLLLTNINSTLGFAEQRRGTVRQELLAAQQLLSLAENVERTRIVEPAAAVKTTARSARNSALVGETLAGIPGFVDRVIVVDDASTDATAERARAGGDPRVDVVTHDRNAGVGAAIVTGYKLALAEGLDVVCVMAADNQMDPADLETLVTPVARGELDYAKANRLFTGEAWSLIPRTRYLGNAVLSLLTKIASGYWHVADSQTGYTAISREMLAELDLDRVYARYGFPNDILVHLNVWNRRVRDYPSRPIYGVGERSGIRLRKVVPTISWLLLKGFFWRLREKYVIRDFHPLVLFYLLGITLSGAGF